MPSLVSLVEGPGDSEAVPVLLRKLLHQRGIYDWNVQDTINVGSLGSLRKKLADFITYASRKPECGGVLVLIDLDDGCPVTEAQALATALRPLASPVPIAIAFASREYEAWFLASLATITGNYGLPAGLTYSGAIEARRDVKGWFTQQMPSGQIYKETTHQVRFTHLLDPALAAASSRSFQRLENAVNQILAAAGGGVRGVVTP